MSVTSVMAKSQNVSICVLEYRNVLEYRKICVYGFRYVCIYYNILCSLFFFSQVYDRVVKETVLPMNERLERLVNHCGVVTGSIFALFVVITFLFLAFLRWTTPDYLIDIAVDATGPKTAWSQRCCSNKKREKNDR